MRVLVTWGTKRGGTEGIGRAIADVLLEEGHDVLAVPAREAMHAKELDAVVVGGALYATRWHPDARRFVRAREKDLRRVPVWFFSSGPLDDSAGTREIPPTRQVAILMERVGAQGHATFGGRLDKTARGFPASAMAKKSAGDWRNSDRIRRWARAIALELPSAHPKSVVRQPGRSISTLVAHAAVGWAIGGAIMAALLWLLPLVAALALHAILVPVVFAAVAHRYFGHRGAREPLASAAIMTAVVAVLDVLVVGGLVQGSAAILASVAGFWLPLALVFATTWTVGVLRSLSPMRPPAKA